MGNFYRNVILGTGAAFMLVIMAGYAVNSPQAAPKENLRLSATYSQSVSVTASRAYPDDMGIVEKVRSWFGADITAERAAAHRTSEMRKLRMRAKGHKTYNTRTKGVLYNGS